MSRSSLEALRAALRELAEADAADLLSEARQRARARAAKLLEEELVEELLAAAARTEQPASPPASADQSPSGQAWWTYCVLAAQDAANLPTELEGVEPGSSVEVVHEGELAALVSPVPAEEYDDVRLREHLEDLAWVERTARCHEAVLEETLARITIVPLRLCTLYRDLDGVRRLLSEHAGPLQDSLAQVDGAAEWGVKVFAKRAGADQPGAGAESQGLDAESGASYLRQRQRARERDQEAAELRASCAEAVHERVAACARESISNPPQRPELHGREMAMLLNGAYLVAAQRTAELHETVQALAAEWEQRGFVIELTGPWPAYNFVSAATGVMR